MAQIGDSSLGDEMGWILEYEPDEPPARWQCVMCEAPAGTPHEDGCKCTLVEGVPIDDDEEWPDVVE